MSIIDINKGKTYYTVLDWGNPPLHHILLETEDLDEAIKLAKEQYGGTSHPDNHAYVVLRDRWDSGDHTPYIDVQPD